MVKDIDGIWNVIFDKANCMKPFKKDEFVRQIFIQSISLEKMS